MGLTVLRPLCEGRRYDLVIDLEPRLLRVQCKLARRVEGVLALRLQTSRYTPQGYVRTSYTVEEIDALGAYSPELKRCSLIPADEIAGRRALHLRLDATKNNQAERIKWASDYDFAQAVQRLRGQCGAPKDPAADGYTLSPEPGAIAQLG
ncbi:MAG TPA: group I intron-associated PD-(D/E)XK endonuclease, partial [Solirubrobacteraceae bacterium]|nr:group I intron-associated PD-(D/E)XK endonuclease [Solirubrobacteraceae bacterium]